VIDYYYLKNDNLTKVVGNRNYFPKIYNFTESSEEILLAFIRYYYFQLEDRPLLPDKIFLNIKLAKNLNLPEIFYKKFGHKITVSAYPRGTQKQLMSMAVDNAANALKTHFKVGIDYSKCLLDFKKIFSLSQVPKHIECFDVSHTMGEAEIASCVVFRDDGFSKKDYRYFNIKTTDKGDDYQALREALLRRYSSLNYLPDIVMIDGGVGQLNTAISVFKDLMIENVFLLAIAKGKARKPGLETIHVVGSSKPISLSPKSEAFRFIQQIRDEAHRFAITAHRKKMRKVRRHSELENILGVGKSKRTVLLKYFGGLSELRSAGIADLIRVDGIGPILAKQIYDHLHA